MSNEQKTLEQKAHYLLVKHKEIERQLEDCTDLDFFMLNIINVMNLEDIRIFLLGMEAQKAGE